MKLLASLGLTLAGSCSIVFAQTERDLDSHVHGAASMNVGIFDSSVFIELTSPWNNLVGFEHKPESEEEHHALEEAIELLNDPNQLFGFNAGDCRLVDTLVESTLAIDDHEDHGHDKHDDDAHGDEKHEDDAHGHDEHDDDAHGDEKHEDDAHGHDKHDDDAHDHDDHSDEGDSHNAVTSSYTYECNDLKSLKSVEVNLFSIWPGFVDIDVQLAGEAGQSFAELNSNESTLDVSQIQ